MSRDNNLQEIQANISKCWHFILAFLNNNTNVKVPARGDDLNQMSLILIGSYIVYTTGMQ